MKRFLMYIVVAIVLISTGFSIYYVVRNDENIYSEVEGDEIFYINKDETLDIPLVRENPASYTQLTLKSGYEDCLDVDLENWTVTGKCAGIATLEFVSTNKKYEGKSFQIHCYIGNGTLNYPYYIRNEQDVLNIGTGMFKLSSSYEVVEDIKMTEAMKPIGVTIEDGEVVTKEFSGTITGGIERHKISNAHIKVDGKISPNSSGFFAVIGDEAKVENLVFENITVEGYHVYAGTIAGANYGLIGMCEVKSGHVTNNYKQGFAGGIAGVNIRKPGSDNYAQINICSANVEINSKWVAGGAVGKNIGGVIYNCLLRTNKINLNVVEGQDSTYSYFGGVAGVSTYGQGENEDDVYACYVSNCLAYIDKVNTKTSHIAGIFGAYYGKKGNYSSEGSYNMLMYVYDSKISAYYLCNNDVAITDSNPSSSKNYAKQLKNEEIFTKKTYTSPSGSNWDFKNVWSIASSESIKLAFDSEDDDHIISYQTFALSGDTITISSKSDFVNALATMRSQPSKNYIYEFTNSIVYDGKDTIWTPIGTKTKPFKGQFKMADDVTLTIKNIKIDAEYAGLFGFISGNNTVIKNIILQDVEYTGTMIGGIAAYNNGATIQNCQINSFDFYTNKYLGSIAGYNSGTIKDCIVCSVAKTTDEGEIVIDEETGETVYTMATTSGGMYINSDATESVFYIGGIVGKNVGTINNVFLSNIQILKLNGNDRTLFLGGAAGMNEGTVCDVIVNNGFAVDATDYVDSTAWVGGLVGYHYKGKIQSSAITGEDGAAISNFEFPLSNENVVAGGLAGYVAKNAEILYSVADQVSIQAYSAGGFAGVCDGNIAESYVSSNCKMSGAYVGGFAGSLKGRIDDCMTAAQFSATKIQAGMTVYLRKGSAIDHCYIDVSFIQSEDDASDKEAYAETSSSFRSRPDEFGTITNTIIVADTKTVTSKDANGNEITYEEVDYFSFYSPLIDKDFRYLTGLTVKFNGVEAKMQVKYHVFEFSENGAIVSQYSALNCTGDGLLSKNGFLASKWNLAEDDSDATQMALPTKAAKVVKVDIAAKHAKVDETDDKTTEGSGQGQSGGPTSGAGSNGNANYSFA